MQRISFSESGDPVRSVSVVIPTYRRGRILLDTLQHLTTLDPAPKEILVVDQTEEPEPEIAETLGHLEAEGRIRWLRHGPPSIPEAMNRGAVEAVGDVILFLDDDVVPQPDLVAAHRRAYEEFPEAAAVAGRILQPEDTESMPEAENTPSGRRRLTGLRRDFDFAFNGLLAAWVENVMAGHLSVRRNAFLAVGGFDARFIPPVSFRFETEFARRLVAAGGKIRFEPRACLRHLRAGSGGTRSQGSHLTSASPIHGVGRLLLRTSVGGGNGARPLHSPSPVSGGLHEVSPDASLVDSGKGGRRAARNVDGVPPGPAGTGPVGSRSGGGVMSRLRIGLVSTAAPDRPNGSMVRHARLVRQALETVAGDELDLSDMNLAPTQRWLSRFPSSLQTPIRYARIAAAARGLRRANVDVLHVLDGSHAYLLAAAGGLHAPVVCTVHDLIPALRLHGEAGMPPLGRVGAWLTRRTLSGLRRASAWVTVSGNTREDLVRLASVARRPRAGGVLGRGGAG